MNRIFLFTTMLLMSVFLTANSQEAKRMVLIEEFSNTGCGPCAKYSPVLDSVVSYRLGDVISVKYHGGYPSAKDLFYLNIKEDMDKKMSLYDISGVPTTVINGQVMGNAIPEVSLNLIIDDMIKAETNFDLDLNANVKDHNLHVKTVVTPKRDVNNSNLRLHVCVIEEYYENPSLFLNGETHVRNITRKMLPNADGYDFGATMKAGKQYIYETDWAIKDFGDENQLGVVAFLQDMSTKEVLMTAYIPRKATGTDELCLMNVEYTPNEICKPDYYGTVTFRNQGANNITSAKLNVNINGKTKAYDWNGTLGYLDRATLDFSDFTDFDLNTATSSNTAEIWFSDINGTTKESNKFKINFKNAISAQNGVTLKIYTDRKPEETTWKVYNSAGEVVDQGGPYSEPRKTYEKVLNLKTDDCYTLEFNDAGGDGIVGKDGNGYYIIYQYTSDKKKKNIKQGDYDGASHLVDFSLENTDVTLGIEGIEADNINTDTPVTVYDISGKAVMKTTAGQLDGSKTANGVSIIKYEGNKGKTHKVLNK